MWCLHANTYSVMIRDKLIIPIIKTNSNETLGLYKTEKERTFFYNLFSFSKLFEITMSLSNVTFELFLVEFTLILIIESPQYNPLVSNVMTIVRIKSKKKQ